jgi:hypothetical protein
MKERSRVTNLVSCEISIGICPTNPAFDKFRYVNFSNLLNPEGMEELKKLSSKFSFWRCIRLKRLLELLNPPTICSPLRSRPITRPLLSQVTPLQLQQVVVLFHDFSLVELSWMNVEYNGL